jgi:preprotein translocase subunit YajC
MSISPAWAQTAGGGGGDFFVSLLPLVLIFVVFWFLLIRPQQKKMREHQQMVAALKKGDRVVTAGGIIGRVVKAEPGSDLIGVEIAPNVRVEVVRGTISDLLDKPAPANANEPAGQSQGSPLSGFLSRLFARK